MMRTSANTAPAKTLAALLIAFALAGCATLARGLNEEVEIRVFPPDARVTTTTGERCLGSCTITASRRQPFSVTASAAGYRSETVEVTPIVGMGGASGLARNLAGPGMVGMGVDVVSGAVYDLSPNPVVIRLEPVAPLSNASAAARSGA